MEGSRRNQWMLKCNREDIKITVEDVSFFQNCIERCIQRYMSSEEIANSLFHEQKIKPSVTKLILRHMEKENPEFFKEYGLRITLKEQMVRLDMLYERQAELVSRIKRQKHVEVINRSRRERHVEAMAKIYQNRVVPTMANRSQTLSTMNRPPYKFQSPIALGNMQHMVNNVPLMKGHTEMVNVHANKPLTLAPNAWTLNGFNGIIDQMNSNVIVPSPLANRSQTHSMNMYSPYLGQSHVIPSVALEKVQPMINATPSYYANGIGSSSQQQIIMQNAVVMQTGMANMVSNISVTKGSNSGTVHGFNVVDSQVMFGANNTLFAPNYNDGITEEAEIPPFNGVQLNSTEVMVVPEGNPFLNLGQMTQEFSLSNLTADPLNLTEIPPFNGVQSNSTEVMVAPEANPFLNSGQMTQEFSASNMTADPLNFDDMFIDYDFSSLLGSDDDHQIMGEGKSGN